MTDPRVLVITSCTGEKRYKPESQLTIEDFRDQALLQKLEKKLEQYSLPAAEMYTGQQHLKLLEGVKIIRESSKKVDIAIISAGYGVIREQRKIVPYEVTFNSMKSQEIDEWANHKHIPEDIKEICKSYDLIFLLLGERYLRAFKASLELRENQTLIALISEKSAKNFSLIGGKSYFLTLGAAEAKQYSFGLVGLKGYLFKRFAYKVGQSEDLLEKVYTKPNLLKDIIEQDLIEQTGQQMLLPLPEVKTATKKKNKTKKQTKNNLKKDKLSIPDIPAAPNINLGMQYFIPEWDDHVDPNYDFIHSRLTPGRDPYEDEVYAHQIYDKPNYDGVLVSKVVIDGSKKKRKRIEDVGIQHFIRYPGPVMGDCGAFGYIKEDTPPYETDEILDYYESLGFNYGVSIDHLIVGPFASEGVREYRYNLTQKNAQEFLNKHRAGGYTFTPIGVAQGWSPETYAASVKELEQMGYDYIAIGGVARTPSHQIIEILKEVNPYLKSDTRLHLFGVARLDAIPVFRHLGVTSFDSASPLRRAWLGSGANYHSYGGKMYTAVRIPPVNGHGVRVKKLIEAGVASQETFENLEANALKALRLFNAGRLGVDKTLESLMAYDNHLELPRDGVVDPIDAQKRQEKHLRMYRELLEERPWKDCDCVICNEVGVDVIIFRGNDRNRRRGFHNTYVFYKRFQELLSKLKADEHKEVTV